MNRFDLGKGALLALLWVGLVSGRAATFRVATYNVESYLDAATETRPVKPAEERAKVRESILALKPDVLALEEMGSPSALEAASRVPPGAGPGLPLLGARARPRHQHPRRGPEPVSVQRPPVAHQ